MRIAIIADSHFDERSRFDECIRMHEFIAADAQCRGCSAWLHAGDVFTRESSPDERKAAFEWAIKMTELVGPGVIVRGNHDASRDIWPFCALETPHNLMAAERANVIEFRNMVVQCLPWPSRASLLGDSMTETEQTIGDALRDALRGLSRMHDGRPRILLSHAMVRGARTCTGQPLVGCDCEVGVEDLALCESDFYALGHIHTSQEWTINGAPVVYPGSPYRTAFGETEPKGYLAVDFDGYGRLAGWERIPTPCAQMLMLDAVYRPASLECREPGLFVGASAHDPSGAEVRLRYKVPQEHRDAAKAAARAERDRLRAAGAVSVKLEEVVTIETRERALEVAAARTLQAKLEAHWDAQGAAAPSQSDRPRILARLNELQAEVGL